METARFDAKAGDIRRLYVNADEYSGQYEGEKLVSYEPVQRFDDKAAAFGHGGSDFYSMYNFVEKALGNEKADTIDVYEALDMFLPGMFAYRSILQGGISVETVSYTHLTYDNFLVVSAGGKGGKGTDYYVLPKHAEPVF